MNLAKWNKSNFSAAEREVKSGYGGVEEKINRENLRSGSEGGRSGTSEEKEKRSLDGIENVDRV